MRPVAKVTIAAYRKEVVCEESIGRPTKMRFVHNTRLSEQQTDRQTDARGKIANYRYSTGPIM